MTFETETFQPVSPEEAWIAKAAMPAFSKPFGSALTGAVVPAGQALAVNGVVYGTRETDEAAYQSIWLQGRFVDAAGNVATAWFLLVDGQDMAYHFKLDTASIPKAKSAVVAKKTKGKPASSPTKKPALPIPADEPGGHGWLLGVGAVLAGLAWWKWGKS